MLQYITEVVQLKIISVGANYFFFLTHGMI